MGFIKLYIGCMYSGKTTELIRECNRCLSIEQRVLCINYAFDNRYGEDQFIYSHDKAKTSCIKAVKLEEVEETYINNTDVILINEGQFFSDLKQYVLKWCEQFNKDIVVSGLNGDFMRNTFGQLHELIPLADDVIFMSAFCVKCKDRTPGTFTWRLSNETEQVVIGNTNYIPVCRKHYLELSQNKN